MNDSDICTRANELELIGAKKKEKGKTKGKEVGVKGKTQELLGRWRGGGSQLANRFIKIGTGAQEVSERSQLHN